MAGRVRKGAEVVCTEPVVGMPLMPFQQYLVVRMENREVARIRAVGGDLDGTEYAVPTRTLTVLGGHA
jgi:hypothetical protein